MIDNAILRLRVTGERTIHCAACERTVEASVGSLPGVQSVRADHETQLIEVKLEPVRADIESVRAELDAILYEVEVVCGPAPDRPVCGATAI